MKKSLLLSAMFLYCLVAISQVKFGAKAGSTFAKFEPSSTTGMISDYTTQVGFQGGIFTEFTLNNYFSLKPELLFSMKGAISKLEETYNVPGSTGYSEYQIILKSTITPLYIDLPVHFKISFASVSSDKFTIGVGPLIALGLSGKAKITGSLNGSKITGEASLFKNEKPVLKDEYGNDISGNAPASSLLKRFDLGISCFAGYEFKGRILLIAGYQHGLRDINKEGDEELRTQCLTVSLGYKF